MRDTEGQARAGNIFPAMRSEQTPADGSVVIASGPAVGTAAAQSEATVGDVLRIPGLGALRRPHVRRLSPQLAGRLALSTLLLGSLTLVAFATSQGSVLVPRSTFSFPHWEAGPLHYLFGHPYASYNTLNGAFSVFVIAMGLAYGVSLIAVRNLSMRLIAVTIIGLHLVLLMAPPMQLTDLFNYLGYARLGAIHHLNPYVHTIHFESHDPIFRFSTWHNLSSPYGELFTAISYPIALLSIPVAYWLLKILAVGASLTFIWLVYRCAQLLGRDPRFAVLFVAANPIYLFYGVAGFHNDFLMLVPSTAAVMFLLQGRDRSAGAAVMLAVAVKFTAVLLLPFLLVAARPAHRRLQVLLGVVVVGVPLLAMSLALFGLTIPNLHDQSTLLTPFSVPNLVGLLLGIGGGTPTLLRLADVALVPVVAFFLYRRKDWLAGAGWSTLALMCTLAWLTPWYIIWVLPLAALGTSLRLRRATLAFSVFLVLTFVPVINKYTAEHNIKPLGTAAGQASQTRQNKLAG